MKSQLTRAQNKIKTVEDEVKKEQMKNEIQKMEIKIAEKDHFMNGYLYQTIRRKVITQVERQNKKAKLSAEDLGKKIKIQIAEKLGEVPLDDIPPQFKNDYATGLKLRRQAQMAEQEVMKLEDEEEQPLKKRDTKMAEKQLKSAMKNSEQEIPKENILDEQPPQ